MNLRYENKKLREGFTHVIGCDEVGRGCLAGPVVAGAVILDLRIADKYRRAIKDSKLLAPEQRTELEPVIKQNCVAWGIGTVSEKIIDKINIHNASLLAMRKAVENLFSVIPDATSHPGGDAGDQESKSVGRRKNFHLRGNNKYFLYLDGKFMIPEFHLEQQAVVDGDNKILSVAAASIVAKVFRDRLMERYHKKFPAYNFAQHKGYATFHHRQMVKRHGLCDIHRISFCSSLI